jgi:hypothetical protein
MPVSAETRPVRERHPCGVFVDGTDGCTDACVHRPRSTRDSHGHSQGSSSWLLPRRQYFHHRCVTPSSHLPSVTTPDLRAPADDPTSYKAVFDTAEAAEHALAASKAQPVIVGGKSLLLSAPGMRKPAAKLFVTGFGDGATREAIADALGVPVDVVTAPRLGRRGMFAHAHLGSVDAATMVLSRLNDAPAVLGGHVLELAYASEQPTRAYATDATPSPWLHVRGFPEATSRETLAEALGVPVDAVAEPTVSARGRYVFVELPSPEAAEALLRRYADAPATLGVEGAPLTLASGGAGPSPPNSTLAFAGLGGNKLALRRLLEPYKDMVDSFVIRHSTSRAFHVGRMR